MRVRHIFRLTTWKQGPGIRSKQDSLMSTFEYIEKIHCNNLRATKLQYPKLWYHSFKIQNYSVIQIRSCTKVSTPPEPLSTPAFEFWRPPTNLGSTLGPSPACVSKTSHSPTANPHCAWEFMFVGCFNSTTTWICNSETFNISWSQHSKKCRYTTKKWYLDEQFFFSPLWKTASLELVGPESWGPFFPPALSEKSWATLSHQKNSTVPIYLPTKLTRTHLNKLCFFKKKNIFPSSVSKKRQEKRKGGFLFFCVLLLLGLAIGSTSTPRNLESPPVFRAQQLRCFGTPKTQQQCDTYPGRKMNKMNLNKVPWKRKIIYKTHQNTNL